MTPGCPATCLVSQVRSRSTGWAPTPYGASVPGGWYAEPVTGASGVARLWRKLRPGSGLHRLAERFEPHLADAVHLPQLLDRAEAAMGVAVFEDARGERGADPVELL